MMQSSSSGGYGQVPGSAGQKKNKMVVMGISSVVLVAMVVGVAVGVSKSHGGGGDGTGGGELSTSAKAIDSICQPTDYKETCKKTLTDAAGNNVSDPKELVRLSFKVTMDNIHQVFNHSQTLQEAHKDPRTAHALQNCQELLDYSVDDLQQSFEQMGELDYTKIPKIIDNLKIWLSASMTYEETCLDEFQNTTGDVGEDMRRAMNVSMELTNNALAIVNGISSIMTDLKIPLFTTGRRLFSEEGELSEEGNVIEDGLPKWLSSGKRRLLQANPADIKPNVVVAQDGSGKFKSINEALKEVPPKNTAPFVIYVKAGVYKEQVFVDKTMTNVVIMGDGPTKTRITGSLNFIDGVGTFKTCTLAVVGNGFIGRNFGVENTAGPAKHQAVAIRVQSDMSVFYNCAFDAYQDTLYAHTHRQFYRDCSISGTIDFIFGNAASIFQNCLLMIRKPLDNQQNIITAHGRKDPREPTAIILHNCTIIADKDLEPFKTKNPSFLGRPWKEYSRTFVMQSEIGDVIDPKGWLPWSGDFALNTCFYVEFDNKGPGAGLAQRVAWKGIKQSTYEQASEFTVEKFIQGGLWLKPTGVPYIPGLLPVGNTQKGGNSGPVPGVVTAPGTPAP